MSQQFDGYAPENFQLNESQILAAIQKVSRRDMEDIKFAQTQIRRFAEEQKASIAILSVETVKVLFWGYKNIFHQSVGCYVHHGKCFRWCIRYIFSNSISPSHHNVDAAVDPHPAIVAAMHMAIFYGIRYMSCICLARDTSMFNNGYWDSNDQICGLLVGLEIMC